MQTHQDDIAYWIQCMRTKATYICSSIYVGRSTSQDAWCFTLMLNSLYLMHHQWISKNRACYNVNSVCCALYQYCSCYSINPVSELLSNIRMNLNCMWPWEAVQQSTWPMFPHAYNVHILSAVLQWSSPNVVYDVAYINHVCLVRNQVLSQIASDAIREWCKIAGIIAFLLD